MDNNKNRPISDSVSQVPLNFFKTRAKIVHQGFAFVEILHVHPVVTDLRKGPESRGLFSSYTKSGGFSGPCGQPTTTSFVLSLFHTLGYTYYSTSPFKVLRLISSGQW